MADRLGYLYLDTGAMYRAVTHYFLRNHIETDDAEQVETALAKIQISFRRNPDIAVAETYLNGQKVEEAIRSMEVTRHVSRVSTLKAVRVAMVKQQQTIAAGKGAVLDGRDIGTVVLPTAELKIFMTASPEVRVQRRFKELKGRGLDVSVQEIRKNLEERDYIDTHRKESPLVRAKDAIILDNSGMDPAEQLEWAVKKARALINT